MPMAWTYALSDIHGCLTKLEGLMERCRADGGNSAKFVFLGDYIDRGPDTQGVLEFGDRPAAAHAKSGRLPLRQPRGPGAQRDRRRPPNRPVGGLQRRRQGAGELRRDGPSEVPADHVAWLARWRRITTTAGVSSFMPASIRPGRSAGRTGTIYSGCGSRYCPTRATTAASSCTATRRCRAAGPICGQPGQHQHRRRARRTAHRGGVRRRHARTDWVSAGNLSDAPKSPSASAQYFFPDGRHRGR